MSDVEDKLQAVAESVGTRYSAWYGIGARDVEEVLRQSARLGLVTLNFNDDRPNPIASSGPVCNLNTPWLAPD